MVLIETVGVGQSEVEVVQLADTTVVLLAPGMGDGIQAAKAGILEIADVFVVNKADRDGADQVARDLRYMLSLGGKHSEAGAWRPPIVKTVAARDEGVDELVAALDKHRDWMAASGELQRRRQARAGSEIEAIAVETVRAAVRRDPRRGRAGRAGRPGGGRRAGPVRRRRRAGRIAAGLIPPASHRRPGTAGLEALGRSVPQAGSAEPLDAGMAGQFPQLQQAPRRQRWGASGQHVRPVQPAALLDLGGPTAPAHR